MTASTLILPPLSFKVLRGDGFFAMALALSGLLSWRLQAELTQLPAPLLLGTSIALLLYSACALLSARSGAVPRRWIVGLALFNLDWALVALALLVTGWVQPNALGQALLGAHVLLPAAVAGFLWRALRDTPPAMVVA